MRNKWLWWVLAALIGVPTAFFALYILVFVGFFLVAPTAEDYSHRTTFDGKAWRDRSLDHDPGWPTRLRMVDDLIAKHQLDGVSRDQILLLLGPADETGKWKDWDLVYWLGPERGVFRIDSEWLVIRFDRAGRGSSYEIVRD